MKRAQWGLPALTLLATIGTDNIENTPRTMRELAAALSAPVGTIYTRVNELRALGYLESAPSLMKKAPARLFKVTVEGWLRLREVAAGERCWCCGELVKARVSA